MTTASLLFNSLLALFVLSCMVVGSLISQHVQTALNYHYPITITWLSTSCMCILLLVPILAVCMKPPQPTARKASSSSATQEKTQELQPHAYGVDDEGNERIESCSYCQCLERVFAAILREGGLHSLICLFPLLDGIIINDDLIQPASSSSSSKKVRYASPPASPPPSPLSTAASFSYSPPSSPPVATPSKPSMNPTPRSALSSALLPDEKIERKKSCAKQKVQFLLPASSLTPSLSASARSFLEPPFSVWQLTALIMGPFTFLWLAANIFFTAALALTRVSTALAQEQTATVFVVLGSFLFLRGAQREPLSFLKLLTIAVLIGGVVVMCLSDNSSQGKAYPHALDGDLLCIASTLATAGYMILFSRCLAGADDHVEETIVLLHTGRSEVESGEEKVLPIGGMKSSLAERAIQERRKLEANVLVSSTSVHSSVCISLVALRVCTIIGLIGLSSLLFYWPFMLLVYYFNFEDFHWPSSHILLYILLSLLLTLLFNLALNIGLTTAGPVFMRIATACSIPASFLVDFLYRPEASDRTASTGKVVGTSCIFAGFICYTILSARQQR